MFKNPDFIVGGEKSPYLLRWYITPWSGWWRTNTDGTPREVKNLNRLQRFVRTLPNVYVHKFLRSDDDRALHDHPWGSMSIIIKGGYLEHKPDGVFKRKAGRIYVRGAKAAHRVELLRDYENPGFYKAYYNTHPAWTIFITGFKVREWGFHCFKIRKGIVGSRSYKVNNGYKVVPVYGETKELNWVHWTEFTGAKDPGSIGKGCGEQ